MSSYCQKCNVSFNGIIADKKKVVIDDWLYAQDECPKCGKVFYSTNLPSWKINS